MLSKKVCIVCIDRWDKWNNIESVSGIRDENNWKDGTVSCPKTVGGFDIIDAPPKSCPYVLEHVISDQDL